MNIRKAYEIHDVVENLEKQDVLMNDLCRAIANYESFERGELRFRGKSNDAIGDMIIYSLPVDRENIKMFLDLLLESMTDKKKKTLRTIEEI